MTDKLNDVCLNRESTGHFCRASAQIRIVLAITETIRNCSCQPFGGWGISRGKVAGYSINEPRRNAADRECRSWYSFQGRLHADHTEWFWPYAWDD